MRVVTLPPAATEIVATLGGAELLQGAVLGRESDGMVRWRGVARQ
jgi:hypothetical protein